MAERGIRIAALLIPQTDRYHNKKRGEYISRLPALLAAPYLALTERNGKRVTLSFIAATPGHGLQRLKEVDELSLMKRPIRPGIECPNKAPAIRDNAVHGIADTWMGVPAGINAILLSKTSDVPNL